MGKSFKFALAAILGLTLIGAPMMASAQDDKSQQIIPSLEYDSADVREALRALFRSVNVSYTIAPEVQGLITVSLKNQTFEVCLQNVLRQVNATYGVVAGVYNITPRNDVDPINTGGGETVTTTGDGKVLRRIKIRHADPMLIMILIGSQNGSQITSLPPELTSLMTGGGQQGGGQGGGFGGGQGGFGGGQGGIGGGQGGNRGGGGFGGGGFGGGRGGGGGFGGGGGGRGGF
jgi:hypothetical protein